MRDPRSLNTGFNRTHHGKTNPKEIQSFQKKKIKYVYILFIGQSVVERIKGHISLRDAKTNKPE